MVFFDLRTKTPEHQQRVMVRDSMRQEIRILTWNNSYKLWDDEFGDDIESRDLIRYRYWQEIPKFEYPTE